MTSSRLLLRPLARIRTGALLARVERTVLGPRAEEELFRVAEVLSEGAISGTSYFGSTLVTIELARLGIADEARARDLLAAAERSVRVRLRAMRLAQSDALRRMPDLAFGTAIVSSRMRLEGLAAPHEAPTASEALAGAPHRRGLRLLVDVDLELPIALSSAATPA